MMTDTSFELRTRHSDGSRASELFDHIEAALREARERDEVVSEALRRVRTMLHGEFRDLTIVRGFVIEDELNFSEWHVMVRFPDGREVALTHES